MILVDNLICCFCNELNENICHVYWECKETQAFWNDLEGWLKNHVDNAIEITKYLVWFGTFNTDRLLNHIILSAKKYIHLSGIRQNPPKLHRFLITLRDIFTVERFLAIKNNDLHNHDKKWLSLFSAQ